MRKAAEEGAEYGGPGVLLIRSLDTILRLWDIKQLLQENNMIRFEAYKDHIGNVEEALMEQAWRQGKELQGYFISLD